MSHHENNCNIPRPAPGLARDVRPPGPSPFRGCPARENCQKAPSGRQDERPQELPGDDQPGGRLPAPASRRSMTCSTNPTPSGTPTPTRYSAASPDEESKHMPTNADATETNVLARATSQMVFGYALNAADLNPLADLAFPRRHKGGYGEEFDRDLMPEAIARLHIAAHYRSAPGQDHLAHHMAMPQPPPTAEAIRSAFADMMRRPNLDRNCMTERSTLPWCAPASSTTRNAAAMLVDCHAALHSIHPRRGRRRPMRSRAAGGGRLRPRPRPCLHSSSPRIASIKPLPERYQEGQDPDPRRVHRGHRTPSQARHQVAREA